MSKNLDFPKAFLFDLDGVLIDSEPLHGQAWKETAALFDLNLTNSQLSLLKGRRRIDCAKELVRLIPKVVEVKDLLDLHKPISRQLIRTAKAMQGGENLVRRCHENNIPMALVTSSSSESFKIKTAHHQWMNLFTVKVLGDDKLLSKGKPAPDPYLLAAKKLNLKPEECWAVEDSFSGLSSALEAGCFVFFLQEKLSEVHKKEVISKKKNFVHITHLKEIEKTLDEYQINKVC